MAQKNTKKIMQSITDLNNITVQKPSVLVCQVGARHRYAVPRMFEDAGMLAALYTDSSSLSVLGRLSSILGSFGSEKMKRLARRVINGVKKNKIYSTDYPIINEWIERFCKKKKNIIDVRAKYSKCLSSMAFSKGISGADIIYTMNLDNLDFVGYGKSHGCKSVIDVFQHPRTLDIYIEEYKKWPELGYEVKKSDLSLMHELYQKAFELADILLCPSEWVAEGVREINPQASIKIRVVPYGCTIDYGNRLNRPIENKIFFAGGNAIGKGLPYLAQAATLLRNKIPGLDVRIAGLLPACVVNHPLCKDLNFLGKLSSEQMKEEYLSADLFVLPSLTEGFAGVIAEAIRAGCPVVVTRESGSPVVQGREGLIVAARSTDSLVDAISTIVADRNLRNKMSKACIEQIPFYSEIMWKKRLIAAIT